MDERRINRIKGAIELIRFHLSGIENSLDSYLSPDYAEDKCEYIKELADMIERTAKENLPCM